MSSSSAQAHTRVKPLPTFQGRIKELLALLEGGTLAQPFASTVRTMVVMLCNIRKGMGSTAPLDPAQFSHLDSLSSDIWRAFTDLKGQVNQRIRQLDEIEKSLPKQKQNDDKTPTALSYHASSSEIQQWLAAIK